MSAPFPPERLAFVREWFKGTMPHTTPEWREWAGEVLALLDAYEALQRGVYGEIPMPDAIPLPSVPPRPSPEPREIVAKWLQGKFGGSYPWEAPDESDVELLSLTAANRLYYRDLADDLLALLPDVAAHRAAVDERDQLAVTLAADGRLLTRILRVLHPECVAFPGSPNQCEWMTCDCSACDDLDHQVAALQRQRQEEADSAADLVNAIDDALAVLQRDEGAGNYVTQGDWDEAKRILREARDADAARLRAAGGSAP